jgi:thiol-disulfide isomerase/thioredoxin
MEIGKWKMGNRKWKLENGKSEMENRKWKVENRTPISEFRIPNFDFRISSFHFPISSFHFRFSSYQLPIFNYQFLVLTLAGLAGWLGCSRLAVPPEPPPPANVADLDEKGWAALQERYRGRVLLVDFWATWCEPCREEFPALVRLHQNYRGRGLSVVAISMDEPESVPAVEQFLKAQGAQFGSYRHHFRDFVALVDSINPRWGGGIPATFLYDRQGKLVDSWQGPTSYAEFDRTVRPLLP